MIGSLRSLAWLSAGHAPVIGFGFERGVDTITCCAEIIAGAGGGGGAGRGTVTFITGNLKWEFYKDSKDREEFSDRLSDADLIPMPSWFWHRIVVSRFYRCGSIAREFCTIARVISIKPRWFRSIKTLLHQNPRLSSSIPANQHTSTHKQNP